MVIKFFGAGIEVTEGLAAKPFDHRQFAAEPSLGGVADGQVFRTDAEGNRLCCFTAARPQHYRSPLACRQLQNEIIAGWIQQHSPGKVFIVGLPMKRATNRLAGWR